MDNNMMSYLIYERKLQWTLSTGAFKLGQVVDHVYRL